MPGARIVTELAETAMGVEPDEFAVEPPPPPAVLAFVPGEDRAPGFVDPGLPAVDPVVFVVPVRVNRAGSNGRNTASSSPRTIRRASRSPVAGPSVTPSIAWPVAKYALSTPGARPIAGRPSGVIGRNPAHGSETFPFRSAR